MIPLSHVYNKLNICNHMGYQLINGKFTRTLSDYGDEEAHESDEEAEPQAEHLTFEGRSGTTNFQGRFDRLEEVVGSLRGKVHQVDVRIDGLIDRMSSMEARLMGQLNSQSVML